MSGDDTVPGMRTNFGPQDLRGLLDERHLAVLATHRRDGSVLLSPLWHIWEHGGFTIGISAGDIKITHLRRDPRVTIVVAEELPPYRGFEVRGEAQLSDENFVSEMRRIARRYVGAEGDGYYGDDAQGTIVRIEPGLTRGWDFADD